MPLALKDNAVFLKNVRERMRTNTLLPVAVTVTILVAMILFLFSLIDLSSTGAPRSWWAFFILAIGQGIVLLLSGSGSVATSAGRERQAGTLDFHRTSPTSSFDIVIGLILGPPVVEWLVVLSLLPLTAGLALFGGTSIDVLVGFYASLFLCAIFLHVATLLGVMAIESRRIDIYRSSWPLALAVFAWIGSGIGLGAGISVLANSTCIPAYMELLIDMGIVSAAEINENAFQFFKISMPYLLLQVIIQAPLGALLFVSTLRRISRPERPIFTKGQSLALFAFLSFLFIGTVIVFLPDETPRGSGIFPEESLAILVAFMYFAMFAGMLTGAGCTPSRLTYLKGLRRARKRESRSLALFDDHTSNAPWLASYAVVTLAAYGTFAPFVPIAQYLRYAVALMVAIAYVVWFLAALEAFRLGNHHEKRNLFVLAIAVPWFFIPLFSFVFSLVGALEDFVPYFLVACPFFGVGLTFFAMSETVIEFRGIKLPFAIAATIVNTLLAVILLIVARRQRKRLDESE